MAIPTIIHSSDEGFPQSVEWALRATHKAHGTSFADPTPFNILRDAASRAMRDCLPCPVKDFPNEVVQKLYSFKASHRYVASDDAIDLAIRAMQNETRRS